VNEEPLDRAALKKQQVEAEIERVTKTGYQKLRAVMNAGNAVVNMIEQALTGVGVSISQTTRAVIQAVFNIAGAFSQIAMAETVTPYQQAAAIATFAQSVVMIGIANQMESSMTNITSGLSSTISSINTIAGTWRWDW
jgi:hypothetical protein